jgi:hypothetical protein
MSWRPLSSVWLRAIAAVSAVTAGCVSPTGDETILVPLASGEASAAPACESARSAALAARASGAVGLGRSTAMLSVVDRSIVGTPGDYTPDTTLPERELELIGSQRARREVAWQIARRVLAPVGVSRTPAGESGASLALWQTWHNKDDLTRIFRRLYPELTPDERSARAPFGAPALDAAWAWNDDAVADFDEWTEQRLDAYRQAVDDADKLAGLGGVQRVAYAPAASRRLLESYPEVLGCRETPEEDLEEGSALTEPPAPCAPAPAFDPVCLTAQFPAAAAQVKATWARLDAGVPLYAFDTSAESLARKLSPAAGATWGEGDRRSETDGAGMYTLVLPNGNRFGLTGLHIMTKELEHWVWITLWWSDRPDEDFGEDRPADFPSPFSHYKLCSVVAFDEADPEPGGGFDADAPSLARALAQTHSGVGGPSWCSNPYIEEGAGNAATNCLGCHQHAGTALRTEDILDAANAAGRSARSRELDTFPSDYVFSVRVGDDLGAMFDETEQHYAAP